jgi:hypothetical protein
MKHPVDNQLIIRLHRATGQPILLVKEHLQQFHPDDQMAGVIAAESQRCSFFTDPLEYHETIGPIIREVLSSVAERVQAEHERRISELRKTDPNMADLFSKGLGLCHRIWRESKQQLKAEYGIDWRSPAELNPGAVFD